MMSIRTLPLSARSFSRALLAAALLFAPLAASARLAAAATGDDLLREILFSAGVNSSDRYGSAIAGLRNFRGDGVADLAIGAPNAEFSIGRVYLLRAGGTPGAAPWMSFGGRLNNERFGYSLAAARDVNGDGWSDLVVGAPGASCDATLSGCVTVYFGGSAADNIADLRFSGTEVYQQFGITVAVPGDVNGDGWDDVLVGAYNQVSSRGTVSLFFGGPAADSIPDLVIHSRQLNDYLGTSISGAGDMNHDGFADFVVGAPLYSVTPLSGREGRVWMYFGGASPDTVPDLFSTGRDRFQQLGQWVSGGGDVNGDGYGDVLAGDLVRTSLYLGGAAPDSLPDVRFSGGLTGAVIGDVNSDGFDDVAVGNPYEQARVFFGSAQPDANADFQIPYSMNAVLAHTGDLDGDTVDDLAIGLPVGNAGAVRAWHVSRYLVVEPAGGEKWVAGGAETVRWIGFDSVAVDLSLDNGASWQRLAVGSGGGLGKLEVDLPDTLTDIARMRLTPPDGPGNPANNDASDGPFSLAAYDVLPPGGGPDWFVADRETLSWRGARAADVYLSARGGGSPVLLAPDVGGAAINRLEFEVPFLGPDSVVARVAVAGTDGAGLLGDESLGAIRIIHYQLVRPNGRETWLGGTEDSVVWIGATRANLQLSLDDGASWSTLATNVGGAHLNRETVHVPRAISIHARVRVVAVGQPAYFDESDRSFLVGEPPGLANLPVRVAFHSAWGDSEDVFGQSIASAGDVNGDGYSDLIVGAPLDNIGNLSDAGSAEVFFGGPDADDRPDVVISGTRVGQQLGFAVAGIGDFDGDGFDDFVVGAPGYASGTGIVYLFRGGPALNNVADATFTPKLFQDGFGQSLAALGDINGDGLADFAVGARYRGSEFYVPVFFGSATLEAAVDVQIVSPISTDVSFGPLVAPAGDFNGDGWPDLMVRHRSGTNPTTVYFYWGGPGMDGRADWKFDGPRDYEYAWSMAPIGDFNGDGFDDVAIGTPYARAGISAPGNVRIYLGGRTPGAEQIVVSGLTSGELFGVSIAGGRDVNGDGFPDLVVGASSNGAAGTLAGRAYIYYGFATPDTLPGLVLDGPHPRASFGLSVAMLPRFGDSGFGGFAVGAPRGDARAPGGGEAFAYEIDHPVLRTPIGGGTWIAGEPAEIRWSSALRVSIDLAENGGQSWTTLVTGAGGSASNRLVVTAPDALTTRARVRLRREGLPITHATSDESRTDFRIAPRPPLAAMALRARPQSAPGRAGARAGTLLAAAGDVNGDGRADLLTARRDEEGGAFRWVVELESGAGGAVLATYVPAHATDAVAIAGAGDVNGDGFADVAIGVPGDEGRGVDAGRVAIYWGGVTPDTSADLVLQGAHAGDRFGASVAAAGDLDGDEHGDLVVGAPRVATTPPSEGAAYIFLGGTHPDAIPDATLPGHSPGDAFGASVAGLGDVDGDSRLDLAIGAPGRDPLDKTFGHVYLYRAGDWAAELTLNGEGEGDRFGQTVGAAGDANRDGFQDVLVGAPYHDGPLPDAGRAYLFLGGTLRDVAPDAVMSGGSRGAAFGASLAGGVDVNSDGYADWLVGSPYAGGDERGGASLYEGSLIPDGDAERAWSGAAAGDRLGAAVALLPRTGGAGYADVMMGAPYADAPAGGAPLADAGGVLAWEANRWWIASPSAGETWPVGSEREIRWQGSARADVVLLHAGGSEEPLAAGAGGSEENTLRIRVRGPGGSAHVRLRSSVSGVAGEGLSDSVSLDGGVALKTLTLTRVPGAGVRLEWATVPNLLDGGVTAYRLYRRAPGLALSERIGPDSIRATSYVYPERVRGATYVLSGLMATGTEVVLGETTLAAGPAGLQVWPVPLGSGANATIEFAPPTDARGRSAADLDVSVFDVAGRRVATLARGALDTDVGVLRLEWSGKGGDGQRVDSGIYFVRVEARSAGFTLRRRLVVTW